MKVPPGLEIHHCIRMSNEPRVLRHARRINKQFIKEKKTDLEHIDADYEAVYLTSGREIVSIIVFGRVETHRKRDTYYWLPVVHTHPDYRGIGCYGALITWLKRYAVLHGGTSLSTEVKAHNEDMLAIQDRNWEREYIRFKLKLR